MSFIARFLVMAIVWLLFTALAFYTCVKPECCPDVAVIGTVDDDDEDVAPIAPVSNDFVIVSSLNDDAVVTGDQWADLRARLLRQYQDDPGQTLLVAGNYYAPEGEQIGLDRAAAIRDLLVPEIPADRIELAANLLEGDVPSPDEAFRAGVFDWRNAVAPPDEEIIEITRDEIDIRFPFDESRKSFSPEIEAYLQKLAERVAATGESIEITGHTDYIDTEAYNMRLGERRAEFVKDALVRYGAPAASITTNSRGEMDANQNNPTAEERRRDRRAHVRFIRN